LKSIQAKLSNTNFVENAPKQVVDNERKKEADTLQKLQSLAHQLTQWNA
jgi:valyl-tRNA synthetase